MTWRGNPSSLNAMSKVLFSRIDAVGLVVRDANAVAIVFIFSEGSALLPSARRLLLASAPQ
jgi:hypothetical protein